jgi:hypothetical protein
MLGKLFGSNTRVKILKLFLLHPESRFYIRQIARGLKLQLNSVRRELENLENFGLLISSYATEEDELTETEEYLPDKYLINKPGFTKGSKAKQDKKYYQANKDFVLFEEVKALIIKAQILYEKDFVEKLYKAGKPKLLILTGFFINNHNTAVDLLIVGHLKKNRIIKLIKDLEKELGVEINFTFMGLKEFKYRRDITDVFLYDILEGKKIVVIDEMGVS